MKRSFLILTLVTLIVSACCISCDYTPPTPSIQEQEQAAVEKNAKQLKSKVGIPQMNMPLDRVNTKRRLETFDDENKLSYIYLISYGQIMAYYPVLGKVTSGNKRLTTTQKLVKGDRGEYHGDFLMEAPGLDGTYGSSDSYVFFWTPDGVYVQWNDSYMLCDQPLKLTQKPILTYNITN